MPISTEPSTFEFTQNWLLSSETFLRDAMGAGPDEYDLDSAREFARARIHDEEAFDRPAREDEGEAAPDLPESLSPRPRVVVITLNNERKLVGTGPTFAAQGTLALDFEIPVPEQYRPDEEDDDATAAQKFRDRRTWGRQLQNTIRSELEATKGQGSASGEPYLNAVSITDKPPADPEDEDRLPQDFIGWTFEVVWKG